MFLAASGAWLAKRAGMAVGTAAMLWDRMRRRHPGFAMRPSQIAGLAALCLLAACAPPDFPEERVFGGDGPRRTPPLEPVAPILDAAAAQDGGIEAAQAELAARGARLRSRAEALRQAAP